MISWEKNNRLYETDQTQLNPSAESDST